MKLLFENWRKYLKEETLYHGSTKKYNFKDDFDFERGVGVIYFFPKEGYRHAIEYAKYDAPPGGGYLYTIETEAGAKILDLTDFENYGDLENKVKAYILAAEGDLTKEEYKDFILMNNPFFGMFDFLDYNPDFVNFLTKELQVDGLKFVDGFSEIGEVKTKVVVLFSTNSIATWERRHLNETLI